MFATMATAGLAALVSQSLVLVKAISLLGGLWFVYGGLRLMFRRSAAQLPQEAENTVGHLPMALAYRLGLTAGAVNAQAIIFFSSLFLAALASKPTLSEAVLLVGGVLAVSAVVRSGIVLVFTTGAVMRFYAGQRRKMEALSGGMLALFGIKLAMPAALVLANAL
jgi:threonine/homoserine/homoserine lactone efflux protein